MGFAKNSLHTRSDSPCKGTYIHFSEQVGRVNFYVRTAHFGDVSVRTHADALGETLELTRRTPARLYHVYMANLQATVFCICAFTKYYDDICIGWGGNSFLPGRD